MAENDHNTRVPRPSHNYVPEYQQSGIPFVRTVEIIGDNGADARNDGNAVIAQVKFDFLTRWIILRCQTGTVTIGFNNDNGKGVNSTATLFDGGNGVVEADAEGDNAAVKFDQKKSSFITLAAGEDSPRLEIKCKELFIKGAAIGNKVEIIAGLTNIRSLDFPDQKASNGFTGVE
tara:strand:- start:280 stop:804 length:525 start_codon:yes stop_codon:yes gene_type:complete